MLMEKNSFSESMTPKYPKKVLTSKSPKVVLPSVINQPLYNA